MARTRSATKGHLAPATLPAPAPAGLMFPKPQGALALEWSRERRALAEIPEDTTVAGRLLARVIEAGDYLRTPSSELCPAGIWLLVPMPWTLVELLNQAGSAHEELEHDGDDEPDLESQAVDDEDEENGDRERDEAEVDFGRGPPITDGFDPFKVPVFASKRRTA